MDSEILSSDPITRIQTVFHPTTDGNQFVLEERQDCADIVEANRYQHSLYDQRAPFKGDGFHKVASIPMVVYMRLVRDGTANDSKALKRWLDDPDNKYFRTRPGRLS